MEEWFHILYIERCSLPGLLWKVRFQLVRTVRVSVFVLTWTLFSFCFSFCLVLVFGYRRKCNHEEDTSPLSCPPDPFPSRISALSDFSANIRFMSAVSRALNETEETPRSSAPESLTLPLFLAPTSLAGEELAALHGCCLHLKFSKPPHRALIFFWNVHPYSRLTPQSSRTLIEHVLI